MRLFCIDLWVFCFEFIITEEKTALCPEDGFIVCYYYDYVQDFFLNAVFVHLSFVNLSLKTWKCCCILKCSLMHLKEYLLNKPSFQSLPEWMKYKWQFKYGWHELNSVYHPLANIRKMALASTQYCHTRKAAQTFYPMSFSMMTSQHMKLQH